MTLDCQNFILNFRMIRSTDENDINCIEWIVKGLEIGGMQMPLDIITVSQLYNWAKINLINTSIKKNKTVNNV